MITRLKVLYGGREIGMLIWDKRRGTSYFNFNPALDIDPSLLSPLTIPSDASRRRIPVWGAEDAIYNRLPRFWPTRCPTAGAICCSSNGAASNGYRSRL